MRHPVADLPIQVTDQDALLLIRQAEGAEAQDRWYRAAVGYRELGLLLKQRGSELLSARPFARAATCFEFAGQPREAARSYFDAATAMSSDMDNLQQAGELFNRAAFSFLLVQEHFNAGDAYRRCAEAFSKAPVDVIDTQHNIPPVAGGAHKLFVAATAYTAAGDAFPATEPGWAAMSYWQAGDMCRENSVGYHAYGAYRRALMATIRGRQTLAREELRQALPLSAEQRKAKVDPIEIMENALLHGWTTHYDRNRAVYDPEWPRRTTDREMVRVFREFSVELGRAGNVEEASDFYVLSRQRETRLAWAEGHYAKAAAFFFWGSVCGFGESLWRWAMSCIAIVLAFAGLYRGFGLGRPLGGWIDSLYLSFLTFSNFGHDEARPVGGFGKALASLEIVLGLLMLGMLLTYVTRRVFR